MSGPERPLHVPMITDESAWTASDLPVLEAAWRPATEPADAADLPGTVDLFALDHDPTAWFYATNRGWSRACVEDSPAFAALPQVIPMGYTNLGYVEKRAVVAQGRLLRVWPAVRGTGAPTIYLPPAGDVDQIALSRGSHLWHAVAAAINLSRRTEGGPVLVGVCYRSDYWH